MENLIASLFLPIASGIIVVIIEYLIIKPLLSKSQTNRLNENKNASSVRSVIHQDKTNSDFSFLEDFYKLTIGILGCSGGIVSAITIRMLADDYYNPNNTDFLGIFAGLVANSNFVFGVICLITLVGGVALAFIVDKPETTKRVFWKRVLASGIFGIVGGFGALILLLIGIIILFIRILKRNMNVGDEQWQRLGDKDKEKSTMNIADEQWKRLGDKDKD